MEESLSINKKICVACDSTTTQINNNKANWHIHDGYRLCHNCYSRYVYNSITNKKWRPINNPKDLRFKGKQIVLKHNPRKGVCSKCGAVKGISCKRTSLHHEEYHEDDVLKDTIELCNSCHKVLHDRLRQSIF